MKKFVRNDPWWIWLSFLALVFLHGTYALSYATSRRRRENAEQNRYLGYLGRFFGLLIGVFAIPCELMMHLIMNRMPEPWYTVWNCVVLAYAYFSGVFITRHLYHYLYPNCE